MRKLILMFTLAMPLMGASQTIDGVTYSTNALEATRRFLLTQLSGVSTTLAAPVASTDTTLSLASVTGISINDLLVITEPGPVYDVGMVTGIQGTVVTVTRNMLGTTAASHSANVIVAKLLYSSIQQFYRQIRINTAQQLIRQLGDAVVDAQNAAIAAAQAAIATDAAQAAQ